MRNAIDLAPNPLIASSGLPAWATVVLDGLLGAGVLHADDLIPLTTPALLEVAAAYVRASAAGEAFDAAEAIQSARSRTHGAREWSRKTAA